MRRIYFTALALACVNLSGFAQGVAFRDVTLKDALAQAREENKLVFVDCYTQWCGPCKQMDAAVFPDPEAGEFMNPRFVCVKIDMENGEGPDATARYGVYVYPTFLLLDTDGGEINRIVGYADTRDFIGKVGRLMERDNSPAALEAEYLAGGMSNARLFTYIITLLETMEGEKAAAISREFAAKLTPDEMTDANYWPLLSNRNIFPYGSDVSMFIVDNRAAYEKSLGAAGIAFYYNGIPEGFLAMQRSFMAGNRDPKFLMEFSALNASKVSTGRAATVNSALLAALTDDERIDTTYYRTIFAYAGHTNWGTDTFDYLIRNRERYYTTIGKQSIDGKIWHVYRHKSMMVIKGYDKSTTDADFERMLGEAQLSADPEKIADYINMAWAHQNNDTDRLLTCALRSFRYFDDTETLNFLQPVVARLAEGIDASQRETLTAALNQLHDRMNTDTGRSLVKRVADQLK